MKSPHANAFSLIDLLLVVATIAGIIFVILPYFARGRPRAAHVSCTNNLKQVNYAFRTWACERNDLMPMQVSVTNGGAMEFANEGAAYAIFAVASNELTTPKILICPSESNQKRVAATTFEPIVSPGHPSSSPFTSSNNLSYFVGPDAEDTKPATFLAGDDHLSIAGVTPKPGLFLLPTNAPIEWRNERHLKFGNVAMADGSAQGFNTAAFRKALFETGLATNRLAMP